MGVEEKRSLGLGANLLKGGGKKRSRTIAGGASEVHSPKSLRKQRSRTGLSGTINWRRVERLGVVLITLSNSNLNDHEVGLSWAFTQT